MSELAERLNLDDLMEYAPEVQATFLDGRVREIEAANKARYVELGEILLAVSDGELFKYLQDPATHEAYRSFDRWLCDAAPISRSGGYNSMKLLKELKEIPRDELCKIPQVNAEVLRLLSPKVRENPDVLNAAATMTERDFTAKMEKDYPDQHIESRRPMRLSPPKSARKTIDHAIAVMCFLKESESREEALEFVCAEWLEQPCQDERFAGKTNEEAYEPGSEA